MYKRLYYIGIAAYAVMFFLAFIFYKERIIFLDASFVLFHLIKQGTFRIEVYRFGDALMQVMPLLAYKARLPLKDIIMSFSLSPVLIYFTSYIICGSVLKHYRFALVILLLNVLLTADSFYWPISQVSQGMALLLVIFALIYGKQMADVHFGRWVLFFILMALLVFFHPLMLVTTCYAVLFFLLSKERLIQKRMLYMVAGSFFLILLVKAFFFRDPYEHHSLSGLKNFVTLFPDYLHLYSNGEFLRNCITKYYWVPVLSLGITIFYVREREWMKLALFMVAMIGYFLLVNVSYPTAATPLFYVENLYLPLGFFILLPFVFELLPLLQVKRLAVPVVLLIVLTGLIRLYTTHTSYTKRLAYERQLLDKYGDRKVILAANKVDTATLQMVWGTAYEFWLLSTSERGYTASINIDDDARKFGWATERKKAIVVTWDVFPYSQLNGRYFRFKDTTMGYIIDPQ